MIDPALIDTAGPHHDVVDLVDIEWVDGRLPLAGVLRVVVRPESQSTWFLATVCRHGGDPVVVLDYDLPLVTHAFEFRAPGIWTDIVCEAEAERWTIGLEAFGIAVDPDEVVTPESVGDRLPIGFDLDVETTSAVDTDGDGIVHDVAVAGEVLVGNDAFEIDATGVRRRRWDGQPPSPSLTSPTPGIDAVGHVAVRWPGLPSPEVRGWVLGNRPGWVELSGPGSGS